MDTKKRQIDVETMLKRVKRMLDALHAGEIASSELGLLKVGAKAAFHAEALVSNVQLIEIRTDIFAESVVTEISLHRVDGNQVYFVSRDIAKALPSIPEAIEACGKIRENMQNGLSYEAAIQPFIA